MLLFFILTRELKFRLQTLTEIDTSLVPVWSRFIPVAVKTNCSQLHFREAAHKPVILNSLKRSKQATTIDKKEITSTKASTSKGAKGSDVVTIG
jgi:hypothetical protein